MRRAKRQLRLWAAVAGYCWAWLLNWAWPSEASELRLELSEVLWDLALRTLRPVTSVERAHWRINALSAYADRTRRQTGARIAFSRGARLWLDALDVATRLPPGSLTSGDVTALLAHAKSALERAGYMPRIDDWNGFTQGESAVRPGDERAALN